MKRRKLEKMKFHDLSQFRLMEAIKKLISGQSETHIGSERAQLPSIWKSYVFVNKLVKTLSNCVSGENRGQLGSPWSHHSMKFTR